jgi:phage terminase large subunit-like protein
MRNAFLIAADVFDERTRPKSRWYCDDPNCNGEPHEGFHWCDHPIDGPHDWTCRHCRAAQKPPPEFVVGSARIWLMQAGRGFGKTRSAAEWLADQAKKVPGSNWAVVAPTNDDIQETCFEGESGLLQALGIDRDDDCYNKNSLLVRLPNKSVIRSYSAETPRKARGPNLYGVWLEEIAQWKYRAMWDNLFPAIRRGMAQTVITTTPAPVPLVREFANREDGSVVITRGSTYDNERNLSPAALAELKIRWKGTRRERQELYGELLNDVPGALWTPESIENNRVVLLDA